jgi:hypothetical protein
MVLAIGLVGAACSLTPSAEIEAGGPQTISSTRSTAIPGSGPEQPTETTDAVVVGASATTVAATESPLPVVEEGPPSPEPGNDTTPPTIDDEAGSDDGEGDVDLPVAESPEAGAETETGGETGDDQTRDPSGGFTLPAKGLDDVLVADGGFQAEAHILEVPVHLVYQGRGTHVADLLVEIGEVAAGSTLAVDYGDGSVDDIGPVSTGQHVEVSHAFDPTLTFDSQQVVAIVTQPDGTEHRDRLTFGTRARFALYYSPLRVTALNNCDTFGKGDFRVTWDHGEGERDATFKLGAGESARIGGFGRPGGVIAYDEVVTFELSLTEEDPWGAALLAPWKWDFPFEFRGGPGASNFRPVRQIGDHSFSVTISSSTEEGVSGDDDCATLMSFDVTLDMLDD